MRKAYEKIVGRLIEAMEDGIIPWKRPWVGGFAINAISKKPYRGINALMLSLASGYGDNRFVTFNQAKDLGGHIKAGEKGYPIVFWNFPNKEDIQKNPNATPWAKGWTVFNVEQCEGLVKLPALEVIEHDSIAEAQAIIDNWVSKPKIDIGGDRASYNPVLDRVNMPNLNKFHTAEGYYDTFFHELTHSTGHVSRLNREQSSRFMEDKYGFEELVAEIGGALLCAEAHIDNGDLTKNSAAYLQSWLQAVKNDPEMIPKAATMAAKAVDMIMGKVKEATEPQEEEAIAA